MFFSKKSLVFAGLTWLGCQFIPFCLNGKLI